MRRIRDRRIVLAVVTVGLLIVAASTVMPPEVYSSWWWFVLWGIVAVALVRTLASRAMWRRKGLWILHLSMLLIIAGGALTALTSSRGTVRLSRGETVSAYTDTDSVLHPFPSDLTLQSFEVVYYPGMSFPRDFRSVVTISGGDTLEISMNRIGHLRRPGSFWDDWRLYQSSCTPDGSTVLSVSHDPYGIPVTYAGYLLFAIGAVCVLFQVLRSKKVKGMSGVVKTAVAVGLICCGCQDMSAAPAVPQSFADSLAVKQVLFRGETVPFGCMATDVALYITGSDKVAGMDATRFVASLTVYPDQWRDVPFILVKDRGLRQELECGRYISPYALYARDGSYRPGSLWQGGSGIHDKGVLDLDGRVALLAELWEGELYSPLQAGSTDRRGDLTVSLMMAYYRCRPVMILFVFAFCASATVLVMELTRFRARRLSALLLTCAVALSGALIFAWRWIVAGEAPFTQTSDLMLFTAVVLAMVCVVVMRRNLIITACGLAACGALALVAWIGSRSPQLTPLMPVLSSPWLSVHVSLVMASYALLGFASLCALAGLVCRSIFPDAVAMSLRLALCGVSVLGLGIWTGAMWANVSWGRYWAWDPKETWALVTMLVYALPLHPSLGIKGKPCVLLAYLAFASLSMVMTYAGVNLLPSLHAYN